MYHCGLCGSTDGSCKEIPSSKYPEGKTIKLTDCMKDFMDGKESVESIGLQLDCVSNPRNIILLVKTDIGPQFYVANRDFIK